LAAFSLTSQLDFSQKDGKILSLWLSECELLSIITIVSPCCPTGEASFGMSELIPVHFALPVNPARAFYLPGASDEST
jgi:hypothetical protein